MDFLARDLAAGAPGWGFFVLGLLAGLSLAFLLVRAGMQIERGRAVPKTAPEAPVAPAAAAPALPQLATSGAIPEAIMLVIAAAAAATFPRGARVLSVSRRDPAAQAVVNLWSMEGRRQIYLSHQLR